MERQAELAIVDDLITAEPGQVVQTTVRLRNTSDRVMHYSLRPVPSSPAASWIRIAPDSMRLLEMDDGTATVFVQPPPGVGASAGRVPFAVIADPGPDSGMVPTVVEADIAVGAVHALDCRIVPRHSRGRLNGRTRIEFQNLGNEEVRVAVSATDDADGEKLHFATADGRIAVPSGDSADAFMKIRPDRPIIIGKAVDHQFTVNYTRRAARTAQVEGADAEIAASIAGAWTQKPIISKWMIVAAVLAVAIAALVFMLQRANTPDAVPAAPQAPIFLEFSDDSDDMLMKVRLEVAGSPAKIELQLIEAVPDGNVDLAAPLGSTTFATENPDPVVVVEADVSEFKPESGELDFRFRSVDAEGRTSRWTASTYELQTAAKKFSPPANVLVSWKANDIIQISWEAPPDGGDRTFTYEVRNETTRTTTPVPDATTTELEVEGEPFSVAVKAIDKESGEASIWSVVVPPLGERPPEAAMQAPQAVTVEWEDIETVIVSWESPPDQNGRAAIFEIADEDFNLVPAELVTGKSAKVKMPGEAFGLRVRLVVDDPPVSSAWSDPEFPSDSRPPPVTEPPPATEPPPVTEPPLLKPVRFWILPQGLNGIDRATFQQVLGPILREITQEEEDLSDLEALLNDENIKIPSDRQLWIADNYPTAEAAENACRSLATQPEIIDPTTLSACWVIGPGFFKSIPPPAPDPTLLNPANGD